MNIALIIAGGTGNRMGQDIPKQFMHVAGKPIIIHTLEAFERHPDIHAIAVVCLSGWETVLRAYANQFNIAKLKHIFPGGRSGQESIRNGVFGIAESYSGEDDIVLIHDAVRPLLSQSVISGNIATCKRCGNAITAIECREAILHSTDHLKCESCIDRSTLMRTQTPQTFFLRDIKKLHEDALVAGITNSVASCTLMAEMGKVCYVTPGEEKNIKITTTEDIEIFKSLLSIEPEKWLKR